MWIKIYTIYIISSVTSHDALTWVQVSVFGAFIANGVGNSGKGGGEPVGEIDFILFRNSFSMVFVVTKLHGSFEKFNNSSPLSNVASKDKRDTDVMQIVAEVIRAVRRPHLSTTIKQSIVLKTLTTPRAIMDVTFAMSENMIKFVQGSRLIKWSQNF